MSSGIRASTFYHLVSNPRTGWIQTPGSLLAGSGSGADALGPHTGLQFFYTEATTCEGKARCPPLCVWGLHACGWGCPMKTCTLLVLGVAQGWFAKLRPLPCQQHPPWKQTTSGMQTGLPLPTIRYASFPLVTAANCAVLWFHLAMHIRPERTA